MTAHDYPLDIIGPFGDFGFGIPPLTTFGVAPMTWQQIENSGLTGMALLQKIIDSLERFPIEMKIRLVDEPAYFGFTVHIAYRVPDAYDKGKAEHWQNFRARYHPSTTAVPDITPRQWAAWFCHILSWVAVHEVAEFFVVGGERLFDPHDDEKKLNNISFSLMPWNF